jgi:hypothetical protein
VLEKYARLVGPAHLGAVTHAGPDGADVDIAAAPNASAGVNAQ